MPAWSVRLIEDLNAADRWAIKLARELTSEQLNWKPTEDAWSVGQCIEHLHNANTVYLPPIARALEGQPQRPVEEITPGWLGRWFIRNYIDPSTQRRRARAPKKIAPVSQIDLGVLDRFLESNGAARALVRRAAHYDVNRIRFVNPFVPLVRFTVGTGLEIIGRHERRHLLQAERVKANHKGHEAHEG